MPRAAPSAPGRLRRRPAWLALVLGLTAGCATETWTYTRPQTSPARLDQDLGACRREAHRPYAFALSRTGRIQPDVLNQCMERKGYTVRRDR